MHSWITDALPTLNYQDTHTLWIINTLSYTLKQRRTSLWIIDILSRTPNLCTCIYSKPPTHFYTLWIDTLPHTLNQRTLTRFKLLSCFYTLWTINALLHTPNRHTFTYFESSTHLTHTLNHQRTFIRQSRTEECHQWAEWRMCAFRPCLSKVRPSQSTSQSL